MSGLISRSGAYLSNVMIAIVVPRVALARHVLIKLTGCGVAREDLPDNVRRKVAEIPVGHGATLQQDSEERITLRGASVLSRLS
jgi:hypothetical protein